MRQHGGEQSSLVTLTFYLLTLKVVSESRVTWAISVPVLVFLGLSVLDLGLIYVTDVRQHNRLMPPPIRGMGISTVICFNVGKQILSISIVFAQRCQKRALHQSPNVLSEALFVVGRCKFLLYLLILHNC